MVLFLKLILMSIYCIKACPLIPFIKKVTEDGLMIVKFDRDLTDLKDHYLELFLKINIEPSLGRNEYDEFDP